MQILDRVLNPKRPCAQVRRLIDEARTAQRERRVQGRFPYFQPVLLQLSDGPELHSAFTRDVSRTGLGLLHLRPIEPQQITVICSLVDGETVRLPLEICWSVACGQGWYISGGRFVDDPC